MLCSKQGGSPTWTNFVVSFLTTNKTTNVHHPSESTALGLRFCVNTFGNSKTSMMNPRTYQQHVWDSFLGSLRFSIPKSPKHSKKVKSPARPGSPHENPKAGLGRPRLRSAPGPRQTLQGVAPGAPGAPNLAGESLVFSRGGRELDHI
jgi:hypothetical protein